MERYRRGLSRHVPYQPMRHAGEIRPKQLIPQITHPYEERKDANIGQCQTVSNEIVAVPKHALHSQRRFSYALLRLLDSRFAEPGVLVHLGQEDIAHRLRSREGPAFFLAHLRKMAGQ